MMKTAILCVLLLFSMLQTCRKKSVDNHHAAVAEVEGQFLYYDDVAKAIPSDISSTDSIEMAHNIVRKWAIDVLMYENAKRNTPNEEEIEKMVQEYRKSLIIHQYQQNLIDQRLNTDPREERIEAFYKQYGSQMLLKEPVIKGFLLITPKASPKLKDMREWVRRGNTQSLENIEKYRFQNAVGFEYFVDAWMPLASLLKKLPIQTKEPIEKAVRQSFYEVSDSLHTYLLHINDYLPSDRPEPYELAKEKITNIIRMQMKADYIVSFESDLYEEALKEGRIKIHRKEDPPLPKEEPAPKP